MTKSYIDPFGQIFNQLNELKKIVLEIKEKPKDYSLNYYTRAEAAQLLKLSKQSIDNYINDGRIEVQEVGPKRKLIHHYQIFNKDQSLKNFKYKRKA
ncbi:hypothetical protein WH52_07125 [Tenacibaculum holothuriorum]|uniref:Helix-turn-helix domain-containing protein n=1 Tax=Tenacibaculum holothuriorum TaxID=1635173 RepID=A0A1Y2PDF3_9FLAO|nr:helix-turn-helix domain-containing protein [Tenacibaculum holothuriorum]OSY88516.1 hypothetical protein WH52_07125 [Tenacibaculum holothuriorum]